MTPADPAAPPPGTPELFGRPVDLDGLAGALLAMATGELPAPALPASGPAVGGASPASPGDPSTGGSSATLGYGGPTVSRPAIAPSQDSATLPGAEVGNAVTSAILAGYDPARASTDTIAARPAERDVPLGLPRSPAPANAAATSAPRGSNAAPAREAATTPPPVGAPSQPNGGGPGPAGPHAPPPSTAPHGALPWDTGDVAGLLLGSQDPSALRLDWAATGPTSAPSAPLGAPVSVDSLPGAEVIDPRLPVFEDTRAPASPGVSSAPEQRAPARTGRPRDDFPILQRPVNGKRLVWLDSGATTQKPNVVIDGEADYYRRTNSNVHRGAHTLAKQATEAYETARKTVARFIGAASHEEIVFVRGATEGLNLIANAYGQLAVRAGDEILVTHLEHHSNIVPWLMLCERTGATLKVIPVDDGGDVRLDEYAQLLTPRTKLVSLTHVSNVLGSVVPLAPMIALAHQRNARVVVDGAQSVARLPVDVKCLDADFFVFSGHKVYGPTGIGAVYGKRALLEAMPPWQGGGSMIADVTFDRVQLAPPPAKFEAGTGNIAGAVGLGLALEYLESLGRADVTAHEAALVQYAVAQLRTVKGLHLLGAPRIRMGALPFVIDGFSPVEIAEYLDRQGIAVRAGHHCAQPIVRRFGHEATVRASLGVYNEHDDVDALVDALRVLVR